MRTISEIILNLDQWLGQWCRLNIFPFLKALVAIISAEHNRLCNLIVMRNISVNLFRFLCTSGSREDVVYRDF